MNLCETEHNRPFPPFYIRSCSIVATESPKLRGRVRAPYRMPFRNRHIVGQAQLRGLCNKSLIIFYGSQAYKVMLYALNVENTGQYRGDPPISVRRGCLSQHGHYKMLNGDKWIHILLKNFMVLWQSGLCSGLLNRTRWVRLPQAPPIFYQCVVPNRGRLALEARLCWCKSSHTDSL